MSKVHYFYQGFLSAIQQKIPHKATLVNIITDLLAIDKDAIYRRLRGDVNFSFVEMAVIAKKLGISLDGIAGIESTQSKATHMNITKHVNPTEVDYQLFDEYINFLKFIKDDPQTRILESTNSIPHVIFYDYEYLTRLHIFSWNHYSSYGSDLPFHQISIPERMRKLQKECCEYSRHIKSTVYVWDRMVFERLVENIRFLGSIQYITKDDIAELKKELLAIVNYLEKSTITGKHEDTGNELSIYISDMTIETNYNCIKSTNIFLSQFRVFILGYNISFNEEIYKEVSHWIQTTQRMATLISASGESIRTDYFYTQKKLINSL